MREKISLGQNLHEKNSSSVTYMAFTLVPPFSCMDFMHKVYFSCMDFMHKVYFSYKASTNQLWPAIDRKTEPNLTVWSEIRKSEIQIPNCLKNSYFK